MSLDLAAITEMTIFFILATIVIGGALGLILFHGSCRYLHSDER